MSILVVLGIIGFILSLLSLYCIKHEHNEALAQEMILDKKIDDLAEFLNTTAKEYKDLRYRIKNLESNELAPGKDRCN